MLCKKCGRTLPDDSLFCQYCGAHFEDLTEEAEPVVEEPIVEEPVVEEPEATKAAPAEEPPAAAPAEPKQPAGKATYCKHCGGLVDPETKKCTKCGKQYSEFPSRWLLRGLVAALIIAMGVGMVYLYNQNQALARELDAKTEEASSYESLYKGAESNENAWKEKYLAESDKNSSMYDEYRFYHDYAVIVGDGETNYHSYGCSRLFDDYGNMKADGFWIYNINAAEGLDYDPCPECQSEEDRSDWTVDDYRDELEAINDFINELENAD